MSHECGPTCKTDKEPVAKVRHAVLRRPSGLRTWPQIFDFWGEAEHHKDALLSLQGYMTRLQQIWHHSAVSQPVPRAAWRRAARRDCLVARANY
uniref:Uncharacterized protein n=1 Tax=Oryza barthii TaxID=65489 RepID=A0A0D3EU87_9ORYZ